MSERSGGTEASKQSGRVRFIESHRKRTNPTTLAVRVVFGVGKVNIDSQQALVGFKKKRGGMQGQHARPEH